MEELELRIHKGYVEVIDRPAGRIEFAVTLDGLLGREEGMRLLLQAIRVAIEKLEAR